MNINYFIERKDRLKGKSIGQIVNTAKNILANKCRHSVVNSEPMTIQIEPTNRCNLNCKQCFRYDLSSKRAVGDMEFEVFKKIIKQFKYVFDVSLIGLGESFLNKNLFRMIDLLSAKNIDVSLTTNGTVYNEKIINQSISLRNRSGNQWMQSFHQCMQSFNQFEQPTNQSLKQSEQ